MKLKSRRLDLFNENWFNVFFALVDQDVLRQFCLYLQLAVSMVQDRTVCFHATVLATVTLQEAAMQETLVRALNITKILTPTTVKHSQGRNAR